MWSYYGSKANIVKFYPTPKHDKIIEPFAGSARYALEYFEKDVLLIDKYEVIVRIWKWLQLCSPGDILRLPRKLELGQTLNDFYFECDEAKWLMGFLIKKAIERPTLKPTKWTAIQRPNFTNFSLQRIANNLHKIKHWEIKHGCYTDLPNEKATWFIDPPYIIGGSCYVESSKKICFTHLGDWAKSRQGQVIVCEKSTAKWLPFKPMVSQRGSAGAQKEGIWSNEITAFDNEQLSLL